MLEQISYTTTLDTTTLDNSASTTKTYILPDNTQFKFIPTPLGNGLTTTGTNSSSPLFWKIEPLVVDEYTFVYEEDIPSISSADGPHLPTLFAYLPLNEQIKLILEAFTLETKSPSQTKDKLERLIFALKEELEELKRKDAPVDNEADDILI